MSVPTTEPAKRIATLFKRRLTTNWLPKEIKAYKLLVKQGCFDDPTDLMLVETYYVWNEKKPNNYLRKDLYTFLNNFMGELDRARAWSYHNKAKVKKSNPNHEFRKEMTNGEFELIREQVLQQAKQFKEQMKGNNT